MKYKLTQRQKDVLIEYVFYFKDTGILRDGVVWPDGLSPLLSYNHRVNEILKNGEYDDMDKEILNKFVRPVLIVNRSWFPF